MMAASFGLVLCLSFIVIADSRNFLMSRSLAGSQTPTSMDGSVTWKGGSQRANADLIADAIATLQDKAPNPATVSADVNSTSATLGIIDEPFENAVREKPIEKPVEKPNHMTAYRPDYPFEVHTMLLWAIRTFEDTHPDYHHQSATDHLGLEINEKCVSATAAALWVEHFTSATDMMLQKTLYGMQHGLMQVGHSLVELIDGTNCGFTVRSRLDKLRAQAERLQVLASAGSLNDLDVNVKYEPMAGLTVGGVDIHTELNAFLVAWQFQKGPEAIGRALEALLRDFDSALDEEAEEKEDETPEEVLHETRTPKFWTEVLQTAMERLGGGHMSEECLPAATARKYGDALEDAIARMLQKTKRSMRAGIEEMCDATIAFVDGLHPPCSESVGAKSLRTAASRLHVFASARSLISVSKHVEYEPMKVLKVGGIDVHRELNRYLVAWINHQGSSELANGMVDFFNDFKEHEVEGAPIEKAADSVAVTAGADALEEPDMIVMLGDAFSEMREMLHNGCLGTASQDEFAAGVERAIDHMLQKSHKTMQQGLVELANTSDTLFEAMRRSCTPLSEAAVLIHRGASKLQELSQKNTEGFGSLVQYEPLKTLVVGSVSIHKEINGFITSWRLRSRNEAGAPFGDLMRKLANVKKQDEL